MSDNEEVVLEAFTDFLSAVEAGICAARERIKAVKGLTDWDASKIKWEDADGTKGPYERSDDVNSLDHKALVKDLASHRGFLKRDGFQYWVFKNGSTVGRRSTKG